MTPGSEQLDCLLELLVDRGTLSENDCKKLNKQGNDTYSIKSGDRFSVISITNSQEFLPFDKSIMPVHNYGYNALVFALHRHITTFSAPEIISPFLGIPSDCPIHPFQELFDGLREAAELASVNIIGGTIYPSQRLDLSLAVYGHSSRPEFFQNTSASTKPLFVYITGAPGDFETGYNLFLQKQENTDCEKKLVGHYLKPPVRSLLINEILEEYKPEAMLAAGQGLISSLMNYCTTNGGGFRIDLDSLPLSEDQLLSHGKDSTKALMASLKEKLSQELIIISQNEISASRTINSCPVSRIGSITKKDYIVTLGNTEYIINMDKIDEFSF